MGRDDSARGPSAARARVRLLGHRLARRRRGGADRTHSLRCVRAGRRGPSARSRSHGSVRRSPGVPVGCPGAPRGAQGSRGASTPVTSGSSAPCGNRGVGPRRAPRRSSRGSDGRSRGRISKAGSDPPPSAAIETRRRAADRSVPTRRRPSSANPGRPAGEPGRTGGGEPGTELGTEILGTTLAGAPLSRLERRGRLRLFRE
jgi:hypothetical protein